MQVGKKPVEAKVVRSIFGKLENRVGINGIIVSMSGFSSGSTDQVKEYANKKIILLFGEEDIKKLISHDIHFDILLDEKYKALITRKEIIWE